MRKNVAAVALALAIIPAAIAAQSAAVPGAERLVGAWNGKTTPGFTVDLLVNSVSGSKISGSVSVDKSRHALTTVRLEGDAYIIGLDTANGTITARLGPDGKTMRGTRCILKCIDFVMSK